MKYIELYSALESEQKSQNYFEKSAYELASSNIAMENAETTYKIMSNNLNFYNKLNNKYGLEARRAGNEGTYRLNKKSIFKKIASYIEVSFEKLVRAIYNFIKTIMVKISSSITKRRCEKFTVNEKEFNRKLLNFQSNIKVLSKNTRFKNKINGLYIRIPSINIFDFINGSFKYFDKANKLCNRLYKNSESLISVLKTAANRKSDDGNYSLLQNAVIFMKPKEFFQIIYDEIIDAVTFGSSDAKIYLKESSRYYINLRNPKRLMYVIFYKTDNPKPQMLNIKKYLKTADYRILKNTFFDLLNNFLRTGKEIFINIKNSASGLRKLTTATGMISESTRDIKKLKYVNEANEYIFQYSRVMRTIYGFSVSLLLHMYSEVLYHQNTLLRLYKMISSN